MRNFLGSLLVLALGFALGQQDATLAFENVRVFDGERVLSSATVVVEGDTIAVVDEDAPLPPGAEVIDGAGRTLLPGLIDAHVHAFARAALEQALVFGVTTELDMFTSEEFAARMREEQEAGNGTDRADLFSAGTLATAPGGHGTQFGLDIPTLTAPGQADAWVEDRVAAGADWIKVVIEGGMGPDMTFPSLDEATVRAVIDAAHARELLVVTHVQTLDAARMAIAAGTDGLAHMFSDVEPSEEFVDLAVQEGVFVIPTFAVFQSIGPDEPSDSSLADDPRLEPFLTSADRQSLGNPLTGFEGYSFATALDGVGILHDAGVPILAGTDAPNPGTAHGASLHRELELLTRAGLSPSEALAAATSVPARIFGLDDRGRVAPGLRADLVLVEGDPTEDILATRAIIGVWKAGVRADREAYRQSLADQRDAAQSQAEAIAAGDVAAISDFEEGDPSVAFGNAWVATSDQQAGGDSTASVSVVEEGANGSDFALQVTGEIGSSYQFPWAGAMFQPGAQPFGPADLSSKTNLHFSARGQEGTYRVLVFCRNLGQMPAEQLFEVAGVWQDYSFDLSTFNGCDPSGVQAIIVSAGDPGAFTFRIDDVELR